MQGSLDLFGDLGASCLKTGDTHLHLPDRAVGHHSSQQPTLIFWADRVLDAEQVPRALKEMHEVASDIVTKALKTLGAQFSHLL